MINVGSSLQCEWKLHKTLSSSNFQYHDRSHHKSILLPPKNIHCRWQSWGLPNLYQLGHTKNEVSNGNGTRIKKQPVSIDDSILSVATPEFILTIVWSTKYTNKGYSLLV